MPSFRNLSDRTRRAVMASATLLILVGSALMRFSHPLVESIRNRLLWRVLFVFYNSENVYLRKMPEDFSFALILIAIGCALLTAVMTSPKVESSPDSCSPGPRRFRLLDGVVIFLFPLFSLAVFLFLWSRNLIDRAFAPVIFLVVVLVPIAIVCRRDRKDGIRLGFSMSRVEILGVVAGTLVVLALISRGLNSWKYSFIGDEWAFHTDALRLATKRFTEIPWLSAHGVYDQLPVGMTAWQMIWMTLLGSPTNVSWRFSSSVLMVL